MINPSRQHSNVLYRWESEVRRRKLRKNRSGKREKVVGFNSGSLLAAWKREAVTQAGTRGIDHLMWRTQGAGIVKGWEYKRDRARIPDTFT